jgi:hypothetical protein
MMIQIIDFVRGGSAGIRLILIPELPATTGNTSLSFGVCC